MGREGEQACLPCGCQGKQGGEGGRGLCVTVINSPADKWVTWGTHFRDIVWFVSLSAQTAPEWKLCFPQSDVKGLVILLLKTVGIMWGWSSSGTLWHPVFSHTVASLYSGNQYLPKASGRLLSVESFFSRALPSSTPSRHNWHCRQLALWLYGNHVTCRKLSSHLSDLPAKGNTISCY